MITKKFDCWIRLKFFFFYVIIQEDFLLKFHFITITYCTIVSLVKLWCRLVLLFSLVVCNLFQIIFQ
jgi:hypothetical protein